MEDWTTNEVWDDGSREGYVVWDNNSQSIKFYNPKTRRIDDEKASPAQTGAYIVNLRDGKSVECKTAFQLLTRLFASIKPACYFTYNGIEQQINQSQTNRAISLIYALTGNFDTVGSNRMFPRVVVNSELGYEFLTLETEEKRQIFY